MPIDLLTLTPEDAALLLRVYKCDITMTDIHTDTYANLRARIEAHAKLVPPPMGKDKVWSGSSRDILRGMKVVCGIEKDIVVRARSAAEAVRLLNAAGERIGIARLHSHWSPRASREAMCACMEPGVWVKGSEGWVKA